MGFKSPLNQSSSNGKIRLDQAVEQALIATDGTDDMMRLGTQRDGSIGGVFAKPGKSVYSDDPSDLAFSTNFDMLRVVAKGTTKVQRAASSDTGTVLVDVPTGAGAFLAFATIPLSSPAFTRSVPFVSFDLSGTTAGLVSFALQGVYDPSVGVIKFSLVAPANSSQYASAQSYVIQYFLLSETLA